MTTVALSDSEDDLPDPDGEQIPGGSFETPILIDSVSDSENSESPCSPALAAVVKVEETYKSPVKIVPGNQFRCLAESLESLADVFSDSDDQDDDVGVKLLERSFEKADEELSSADEEILRNVAGVPVFEVPPDKYSAYGIMNLLLDPKINENKIATRRPLESSFSASYVVDVSKLAHPDDIKKDMYGKWIHSGSHADVFRCTYRDDDSVYIEKAAPGASGDNVFYLRRLHSVHPSNSEFRRLLALLFDSKKQPHRLCLLVYYVPENFKPILKPHGNSKSNKPFYGTLPSTIDSIAAASSSGPKQTISEVSAAVGGVTGATDPCCLPRNEQQVTDVHRRRKHSANTICNPTDELSVVMHKAYVEDIESSFIRDMRVLKEPAVIVARDRQLNDMVKFCTNENQFGVVTVDPTFCLGDFDVTMTTYRHLVLKCRRSSEHPVFIGPTMIHYNKTFSTYLFFASSLVGLRPELSKLKCFGTDGEEALSDAFKQACPKAVHLLCSIHFRRNLKEKLKELHVAKDKQDIVLSDIFGSQLVEGLIDSEDEKEFSLGFEVLSTKWKKMDFSGDQSMHSFTRWFDQYKSTQMKSSMLKSIRRNGGQGDPPAQFTTNASESVNFVIKNKVNYKKSELPDFLEKLKTVIDEQERELERAIIDRGKYKLSDNFKKFEVSEDVWFSKMSVSQREAHVKHVLSVSLEPKVPAPKVSSLTTMNMALLQKTNKNKNAPSLDQTVTTQTMTKVDLAVDVSSFSDLVLIPKAVLCAIWKKATELLNEPGSICKSPGGNAKDRIVKSTSGSRPHLVLSKKGGQFVCDNDCPNWKSLSVCSHSVAAAQDNHDLVLFVEWIKKAKKSPNLTKLVTSTMSKGRGKKGSVYVPPRKRKKMQDAQERKTFTEILSESAALENDNVSQMSREEIEKITAVPIVGPSFMGPESAPNSLSTFQAAGVSYIHTGSGNSSVTITGTTATSAFHLPQEPPPLVPYDSITPVDQNLFELAFISGNISVCKGCRQRYKKPAVPPMDLCIRHKEWQDFVDPVGKVQHKFGNVYYHANAPCVQVRWPNFESSWVQVSDVVIAQLTQVHVDYLHRYFPGIHFD